MRRRGFLALMASTAAATPRAAGAQQRDDEQAAAADGPSAGEAPAWAPPPAQGPLPPLVRHGGSRDPVETYITCSARC